MALTQMQLIQSLGESMAWFERELNWGVPPTELRHLCGRIGELYTALITNGQMATQVNQHGYDVVSSEGERISVKTTAMMGASGHVSFNANSLSLVDRIVVLRVNTEEMQIETLLNAPVAEVAELFSEANGKYILSFSKLVKFHRPKSELKCLRQVNFEDYTVREIENGSIEVERSGELLSPTAPALRSLAKKLGIQMLNGNGNPYNTRQLGDQIIRFLGAI
ncbi:DUF6998 domain-containing protein [Allohahella sp. A8]|uniref:DUF6998 domain-containing protein n=1 Tax=Allohahella sp. A8 TaxID=3141461 RepID=UPI003A7F848A